jgi:hypothetical protein
MTIFFYLKEYMIHFGTTEHNTTMQQKQTFGVVHG